MWEFFSRFGLTFSWRLVQDIIDVCVVALGIYLLLSLVRGTRAIQLIKGFVAVAFVVLITGTAFLNLKVTNWVLSVILQNWVIAPR